MEMYNCRFEAFSYMELFRTLRKSFIELKTENM